MTRLDLSARAPRPRVSRALLLPLALLAPAGCGRFGNAEKTGTGTERLVSVSKQYTEIIFALGAEQDLVAVDVSSVYPPEAKQLPTVGYHRALSLEGMLAAKPTLILRGGPNNIGPEHVVQQLEALKIPMKDFNMPSDDIEGAKVLIRDMGSYFHREARADSLCAQLDADMAAAMAAAKTATDTPSVAVIHYGQANNVYLVMSARSTAGKMVQWAGGRMAIDDSGRGCVRSPRPRSSPSPTPTSSSSPTSATTAWPGSPTSSPSPASAPPRPRATGGSSGSRRTTWSTSGRGPGPTSSNCAP